MSMQSKRSFPRRKQILLCGLLAVTAGNLLAAPGDQNWDERFLPPGPGATELAIDGTNVYACGGFSLGGPAQSVARWNGRNWSALGAGITNARLDAIAVVNHHVFVGGQFTNAGGIAVNNIAEWDGTSWSAVGGGVTNALASQPAYQVAALLPVGSDLYVAGNFTEAGGVAATNIAKWDGGSWSALGGGLTRADDTGYALALATDGGTLYAGGRFMFAGRQSATNVAKWDGGKWSPLGGGLGTASGYNSFDYDRVFALAIVNGDLYAGGGFNTAGGVTVSNLAKWSNGAWSALSGGGVPPANSQIEVLTANGNDLYVGGTFSTIGGLTANGFAQWDGNQWSMLGEGPTTGNHITAIATSGQSVYIAGGITVVGGVTVNGIAEWDGSVWKAFGRGLNASVKAIAVAGSDVYAGGLFSVCGGVNATNIARWDGANWAPLGLGISGGVLSIAADETNVYAGGNFTAAGGLNIANVARWDGAGWSALGNGVGKGVQVLALNGGELYVGGTFTTAGGGNITNIAKWDGVSWSALGSGVSGGGVYAIAVSGSNVYAGGDFTFAGGTRTHSSVARGNGTSWFPVGSTTDDTPGGITALAVNGTDLYIGVDFVRVGAVSAKYIARWNGSAWSALAGGTSGFIASMALIGNDLYVTGPFVSANGSTVNYVARWAGTNWYTLGSGLNGLGSALAASGTDLYVGGNFTASGLNPSYYFGIWHKPRPQASNTTMPNGNQLIVWSSEPGENYQVLSTTDLSQPFVPISGIITATGYTTSFLDASAPGLVRYYEIAELP